MYKLIIVDDEKEVRECMIRKIDWGGFNFEIAGEAENGREAVDLIEDNIPDVVVTDITMPQMNGLELAAVIKENYPAIKTVILTGYDDFKFAQQAIKYGVADYILKPVLPKDIDELLKKLKTQLDEEIAKRKDMIMLRKHYNESLPLIKDKFLSRLITSRLDIKSADKKAKEFNLNLSWDLYAVAAASIEMAEPGSIFEENDTELAEFAVLNISKEIMTKYSSGEAFFHDDYLVIIAGFKSDEKSAVLNKSFSILEEIRQNVEKYLKIKITIGLGYVCDSLSNLKDSYRAALSAIDYKIVTGGGRIIYIEDLEPQTADNVVFDENKERALIWAIKFGSPKDVSDAVSMLFDDISGVRASFKEYQLYLIEIGAAISRLSRKLDFDAGTVFGPITSLYEELFKLKTAQEVRNWVEEICIRLMNHISGNRRNITEKLFEKAKEYINANYRDENLSIRKLADELHISPSYLSLIFKKEADVTFLKYLVSVRLEVAKDLLLNSDLKIADIAERTGYPELNYFSYFFKKNFGISPREYRNQFIQKKES